MGALETVQLLYIKGHHNSGKVADYKMGKKSSTNYTSDREIISNIYKHLKRFIEK